MPRFVFLKEDKHHYICKDGYFNHFIHICKAEFSVVYTSNRQQYRIGNCINMIILDTSTTQRRCYRYLPELPPPAPAGPVTYLHGAALHVVS